MAIFKGAGVAIVTPMKSNGEVNYEKFGELIDYQIENGTDSIVVCGTTGEASTLSHEEHLECIAFAAAHTKKRVPIIAGTGSNSTETAIYLSTEAEKSGADALLVVSPYYNKATQKGLIGHFSDIAAAVDIPVILYNIPGRTGCNILPETIAYLVKNVENIVGLKDATDNISQSAKVVNLCDGQLELYSGEDDQTIPILSLGGIGVISVLSNVAPRETHDMVMNFLEGDRKKALELQLEYLKVINALFSEVNPIPVKKALNLMGFDVGPLRKPLTEMEEASAKKLEEELRKVGLL